MEIIDIISAISNFLIGIGTITVAIVAWRGLNTWKEEFRHKRKSELAEEVIFQFYEVLESIKYIRAITHTSDELDAVKEQNIPELEDEKKFRKLAYLFAFLNRHNKRLDSFIKFHSLQKRAKIHFGNDIEQHFNVFHEIKRELIIATQLTIWRLNHDYEFYDPRSEEQIEADHNERLKNDKILWNHGETDEFNQKMKYAIDEVEKILSPFF